MMRNSVSLPSVLVALVSAIGIPSASAQVTVGAIEGVIRDEGGGVLPGTLVEAASPALIGDPRTTVTDENGNYRLLRLPVGTYSVRFSLAGFSPYTREGVVVNSGFTATINPVLQIGSLEETVTVTGESPVIDVRSSTGQAVLSDEVIDTIPNSRTVFDMTKTLLGASTTRPDVGGSSLVLYTAMQIHGSQSNDRSYYKDGIRLAAYFGGGDAPRTYGNIGAMGEVNYQYSALPASIPSGGMNVVMVFKEGGDEFGGSVFSSFGSESLQSSNLDQELRDRGVEAAAGIEKIYDVDTSFGGPIVRDKAWFFGSLRFSSVTNLLTNSFFRDGSQAIDFQRKNDYFVKGTLQPNPTNKFSVSMSHDGWFRPFRRRDAQFVEQEALLLDRDGQPPSPYNRVIATRWTSNPGADWILEAGWGHTRVGAGWEYQPEVEPTDLARLDLVTNTLSGAAATIRGDATHREDFFLNVTRLFDWNGTHELKFGTQNSIGDWIEAARNNGDIVLRFRDGVPDSADLRNTPIEALSHLTELGFYVQDAWNIANRLTINAGLRYDKFRINIAEQSAPAGTWVPARRFDEIRDVPNWDDLMPRLGVSYDLTGSGRSVLKGSFSMYVGNEGVGPASAVNPMFLSTNRCVWSDTNGDLNAQAFELSNCSGFSGGVSTRLDPDLKRQFNREYTLGVQHELAPDLGVSVMYYRRENRNMRGPRNLAIPESSYIPVTVTNPLTNAPMTIFNQDPATVGMQDNVVMNADILDNDYNGIEFVVQRRFARNASLLAGYHYGKKLGSVLLSDRDTSRDLNDPNNFIFDQGAVGNDEPHQFKLSGSILLPGDISFSGVFLTYSGHPRQRTAVFSRRDVPELTRSSQSVALERNDDVRYASNTLLDLRFGRPFRFGDNLRFEPFVDAYNVFNANTVLRETTTFGSSLGRVSEIINPRIIKVGAKLSF